MTSLYNNLLLKENYFKNFSTMMNNDPDFLNALAANLEKNKNLERKKTYWPIKMNKNRLMNRFNIKYKATSGTYYSRSALLCQCVPSLKMCYTLRKLFNIKPGAGHILNIDESMIYRYSSTSKTWTI